MTAVGLIAGSSGILNEENTIGGNANGLLLQAMATGNVLRLNVIAGIPPVQFTKDYGPSIGSDVKDEAATNGARNILDRNWCITYLGQGAAPCSNFPKSAVPAHLRLGEWLRRIDGFGYSARCERPPDASGAARRAIVPSARRQ